MHYLVGQVVEGVITCIQPYGAFVYLDSDHKGLIHISEISRGYVKDVTKFLTVGEKVRVKVIDIDTSTNQCKLSLKAVNRNMARQKQKVHRVQKVPKMVIGFQVLADHLDEWIENQIKREEK